MDKILFRNKVFADESYDEVMLEYGGPLIRYNRYPCERRRDTETCKERCHVTTEAETGVTQLQANGHRRLL